MVNERYIQDKVENALNSLEDVSPATVGPFFYTRVMSRLERERTSFWNRALAVVAQPVVAIAVVVFVFMLDAMFLFNSESTSPAVVENSISAQYNEFYDTEQAFYSMTYSEGTPTTNK